MAEETKQEVQVENVEKNSEVMPKVEKAKFPRAPRGAKRAREEEKPLIDVSCALGLLEAYNASVPNKTVDFAAYLRVVAAFHPVETSRIVAKQVLAQDGIELEAVVHIISSFSVKA